MGLTPREAATSASVLCSTPSRHMRELPETEEAHLLVSCDHPVTARQETVVSYWRGITF